MLGHGRGRYCSWCRLRIRRGLGHRLICPSVRADLVRDPAVEDVVAKEVEENEREAGPTQWFHMWGGALGARRGACDSIVIARNVEVDIHVRLGEEEHVGRDDEAKFGHEEEELH